MKVLFSRLAVFKLEQLSEFLIENWSSQANQKFLLKLDSKIKYIERNPTIYPESGIQPGLRKCIVTKQTSLIYEIQSNSIFILTIVDNRQDPAKILNEIKKHFA